MAPTRPHGFSHKIDYVTIFFEDSKSQRASKLHFWFKVTAILLNGWILPIGGVALKLDGRPR